jgi:hypothetical protein
MRERKMLVVVLVNGISSGQSPITPNRIAGMMVRERTDEIPDVRIERIITQLAVCQYFCFNRYLGITKYIRV